MTDERDGERQDGSRTHWSCGRALEGLVGVHRTDDGDAQKGRHGRSQRSPNTRPERPDVHQDNHGDREQVSKARRATRVRHPEVTLPGTRDRRGTATVDWLRSSLGTARARHPLGRLDLPQTLFSCVVAGLLSPFGGVWRGRNGSARRFRNVVGADETLSRPMNRRNSGRVLVLSVVVLVAGRLHAEHTGPSGPSRPLPPSVAPSAAARHRPVHRDRPPLRTAASPAASARRARRPTGVMLASAESPRLRRHPLLRRPPHRPPRRRLRRLRPRHPRLLERALGLNSALE